MASLGDGNRIAGNQQRHQILNQLNKTNKELGTHQLRLATGRRINSAEGDSSGFVIGRSFQAANRGLTAALNNLGDARSALSTAESGGTNILDILETMKEKATRAATGTLSAADRQAIGNELSALAAEIDDIVGETRFNDTNLLSGTQLNIQSGAEPTSNSTVTVTSASHDAATLGVSSVDVASTDGATDFLANIDTAISTVQTSLASIGSDQARLRTKEQNLAGEIANIEAARSRIEDADFALEQLEVFKLQIQRDANGAAAAQANASAENVLALLT